MISRVITATAACAAIALAAAPSASASQGGSGSGGGAAGGGGGQSSCQIKQLSDSPVLLTTSAAISTTYSLVNCATAAWSLTYLNTFTGTTDYATAGTTDASGSRQATVIAAPLPYNYPYRVTLTVTSTAGTPLTTKTGTLFSPKPKD